MIWSELPPMPAGVPVPFATCAPLSYGPGSRSGLSVRLSRQPSLARATRNALMRADGRQGIHSSAKPLLKLKLELVQKVAALR